MITDNDVLIPITNFEQPLLRYPGTGKAAASALPRARVSKVVSHLYKG
jgi:hypothetical protein